MLKRKVTILLVGLMCFSSMSGFFMVICRGSDGHVALEPAVNGHCECANSIESGDQEKGGWWWSCLSGDHNHCTDTVSVLDAVVATWKDVKLSMRKVFTANLVVKSFFIYTPSIFRCLAAQSHEVSSFFAPLRTVILLA